MALEFAKDYLEYIKETLEWLSSHTVLIEESRTNCETEHSRIQNSLLAIERGLAQCSDENAALPLQDVSGSAFIAKADRENILVLVDDKYKVFNKLREIGKTWKSITIEQIDKVV